MKFLVVIVGMIAISNAAVVYKVASFDPIVSPLAAPLIAQYGSAVFRSLIPAVGAKEVSEAELADWEAYKLKFSKIYLDPVEDRLRRNIYFANKEKVAKYDEVLKYGIGFEKISLDIFADQLRDEIFSLRSIIEDSQEEWNNYKLTYGKIYDSFEDKYHKTIYFIVKDLILAHNNLASFGFVPSGLTMNLYADYFYDDLPAESYELALTPAVLPLARVALPYGTPLLHPFAPESFAKIGHFNL